MFPGGSDDVLIKESEPINSAEDPSSCTVHQGDDITLVACAQSYELYNTQELATKTKGLGNYGETRIATAINNSMEKDKHGMLTYLIDGRSVVTA